MVRYLSSIVGLLFIIVISCAAVDQFTEKRSKKNPSMNSLKEGCCEQFGDLLKQVPKLLHLIADVQKEAVSAIQGYWEGDKQSWCQQASRQKLIVCRERLGVLNTKINDVLQEYQQALKEIKA